jgi:hypothetical protein
MTKSPLFPGFDGLMTLSRREGVDIRPTLLRVLTDLYVQANTHSIEEARQFVELASRLVDQVDDATRAAVRGRLAIYPGTPPEILRKLELGPAAADQPAPVLEQAPSPPTVTQTQPATPLTDAQLRMASNLAMQSTDAAEISDMFFRAGPTERVKILHSLADTPLKASARVPAGRSARAIEALEMAAFVADVENFTLELGETLILPMSIAQQVVNDSGGEPLACAMRALGMPGPVFDRVLLFLKPDFGTSVNTVYRLSRLYGRLGERSSLVMLAAWRGWSMAQTRARYRPALYDDERQRARGTSSQARPGVQPGSAPIVRTGTDRSGR